jgi:hypothetical protein
MAEVFIDPNGSDSNGDGSRSNPWATVDHAVSNTVADDTIRCLAGTYDWPNIGLSSLQGNPRSLIGDTGDYTDVIFDGQGQAIKEGIMPGSGSQTKILDIRFFNVLGSNTKAPISTGGTPGSARIERCLIDTITNDSGVVVGNEFFSTSEAYLDLVGCVFYRLQGDPNVFQFEHDTNLLKMIDCTFWDDNGSAFPSYLKPLFGGRKGKTTLDLKNNIYVTTFSTDLIGPSLTADVDYNCYHNVNPNGHDGPNDITADPLFIDAVNGDFDLRPGSPCIGAGTASV